MTAPLLFRCRHHNNLTPLFGSVSRNPRLFRYQSAQPWSSDEDDLSRTLPLHPHPRTPNRVEHFDEQPPTVGRLILVRHGQSVWNVTDPSRDLTARFTGWADIGLTKQGEDQAIAAGKAIQYAVEQDVLPSVDNSNNTNTPHIDVVYCSLLRRAADTMNIILEKVHLAERSKQTQDNDSKSTIASPVIKETIPSNKEIYQYKIPIVFSWRLNERHYGSLVGLSKEGAERLYGKVRLTRWRDSWDVPPPPMPLEMVKRWGREDHCQPVTILKKSKDRKAKQQTHGETLDLELSVSKQSSVQEVKGEKQSELRIIEHGGKRKRKATAISGEIIEDALSEQDISTTMPASESLKDTYERFLPIWVQGIAPHLRAGRTVLLVGHANTIRSILFAIDPDVVRIDNMKKMKIPSALPLIYEFVDRDAGGRLDVPDSFDEEIHITPGSRNNNDIGYHTKYQLNGRECSHLLPGNVRVLKPLHQSDGGEKRREARYDLNGIWVETNETKLVSFCTDAGQFAGEGDIA